MENSMESPQNFKIKLLYDAAILPLGICPKEGKLLSGIEICTPMFIAALFVITKTWKQYSVYMCE